MRRLALLCCVLAAAGCGGGEGGGHPDGFGEATWSAPAGGLAYVASRHDRGPTAVYLLRRAGTAPLRVTPAGFDAWSPAWSPDGRWIAYAAGRVELHPFALAADDLYLVSAVGRRIVRLTRTAADESSPTWAPDGRRLAYTRDGRVWVIALAGRRARPLTAGADGEPQWSPDGRWIAYVHGKLGNGDLTVVRPDGTGAHRLAGPGVDCPRWSPHGDRIAYRLYGAVRVVGVQGGTTLAPVAAEADGYSCDYAWSPDGRALVVAGLGTDGRWRLQTIAVADFRVRTVATLSYDQLGPDLEPAWAPGRTVAIGGDALRAVDPRTGAQRVLVSSLRR